MAQELVNEIISLRGDNLNEIMKNFRVLLMTKKCVFKDNLDGVLSLLQNEDHLQKFFRLKLIDEFNQHDEVLNILKNGDMFSLKQALKCTWFFQELNDPEKFINDVIPFLSFYTRKKVINLYSKHLAKTDLIENLFTVLRQKYESGLVLILLPSCSKKFVLNQLPTLKMKVPVSVFQVLFSNYPDLAKEYLEFILESVHKQTRAFCYLNFNDYNVLFRRVASTDPKFFMRIYQKYNCHFPSCFCLGKKILKKIIRTDAETFISNFHKYSEIIPRHFSNYMSIDQIEQLQLQLFPKSITQFFLNADFELLEITKKFKSEIRENILLKNFSKAFSRPFIFEDFGPLMTDIVIPYFTEEVRVKWVEMSLPKTNNALEKANILLFLPTSSSISLLIRMTENQSELNARIVMFRMILYSLDFNNDLITLPSVLKYFVSRFRNDQFLISKQVFDSLARNKRLLLAMEINDWEHINELFKLAKLNKQQMKLKGSITEIQYIQILSFFKKGLPMEKHLQNYFHSQISMFKDCNYEIFTNSIYEKTCLLFFLSEVSNLFYKREKYTTKYLNNISFQICKYNQRNKRNRIEIPDWLMDQIKLNTIQTKLLNWEISNILYKYKKDNVFKEKLFPKLFPQNVNTEIISLVLKRTPSILLNHIEMVMNKIFTMCLDTSLTRFFILTRMYSPFRLPQQIIKICIDVLKKTGEYKHTSKVNAIRILCLLMPSNEFLKTVEPYYPKSLQVEYSDEEDELYRIQQEIAQCLKLLNDPPLAVVPMKKFAGGDYLKYVVGSINSISLKIPEVEIIPVLKEWMDSRVSVRKHFIRAFLKIAPKEERCNLLKELFVKENNSSTRLLLFQHTFQFFCQEPCQETFDNFKAIAMKLEPTDTSATEEMFNVHKVADEYISTYIQMLWELMSHKETEIRISKQKRIIGMIDEEILQLLTEEFCETLINTILSPMNLNNPETLPFTVKYILCSTNSEIQRARLDKTMLTLNTLITAHWYQFNLNSYTVFPVRHFLSNFTKMLCDYSKERDKLNINPCVVLKDFNMKLNDILPEDCVIEESMLIDFTIMNHELFNIWENIPSELIFKFIKVTLNKYSDISDAVKIDMIQKVLPFHLMSLEGKLTLSELLLSELSIPCNLIALNIIPPEINDDSIIKYYKNITKLISENPNQNVRIQSHSFLLQLVSTVKI